MKCICGDESCRGFCKEAIGSRLFKFLNEVRMIPLKTGDITEDRERRTLHVVGGQLLEDDSISTIYKVNVHYPNEPKLKGINEVDSRECLQMFLSMMDIGNETLDILDNIEKRKLVITPFKPKTNIKVKIHKEDSNGKAKLTEVAAKVKMVKWSIDSDPDDENKSIYRHLIITDYVDAKTKVHAKVELSDYNIKFSAENFEEKKPKEFNRKQVLKMCIHGYFYPICFQKEKYQIMIDGSNMYYRKNAIEGNNGIITIGEWNDEQLDVDMDLLKKLGIEKDITSKLYGWVNYLKAYKAYIAPLGVAEMNVVKL